MVQLSERVNLAIHALGYMSADMEAQPYSVTDLANALKVSKSHLAKVMQTLVKRGMVESSRGAKGGFSFARDPGEITLLEIYRSMEGALEQGTCLLNHPVCVPGSCLLTELFKKTEKVFREELSDKTVADFRIC